MVKQIIPDKIKITSIRLLGGKIDCPQEMALLNPVIENYASNFEVDFRANPPSKSVNFFFKVMLQALNGQGQPLPITAEYSFDFTFYIENFEEYLVRHTPQEVVIENILASTLMSITYSTSRGMVLSRTEGTILKGIVLPVVDARGLIAHKTVNP